jgi:CRISPR-associated protein Cas6/Cse3/CasE subtype I-E
MLDEGGLRDLPMLMPSGIPENPYELHERLYGMLCGPDGQRQFLWAVEADPTPIVVVRSRMLPAALVAHAVPVEAPPLGSERLFKLVASPARACGGGKKVRLPIGDRAARMQWLDRQAANSGFTLLGPPHVRWWTTRIVRGRQIILRETAVYEGMMRVGDPVRLAGALEHGIGRSRSFGYGLLRLFHPHDSTPSRLAERS